MSIRDLFRTLRRHAVLVIACLIVGLGGGAVLAFTQPPSYTTNIRLFVSSNGSDSTDSLLQNSNLVLERVPSYVSLVNSPLVVNKVVERLKLTDTPDSLATRITATNPLQTALIEITVRDDSAQGVYDLATTLAAVTTEVVQNIETSSTGFAPVKVTVVSAPEKPGHRDLAGPLWRLGLGLLLGIVLGAAIAVGRELFDSRLKDPEQLRTKLALPPLATIAIGAKPEGLPAATDEAYWLTPAGEGFRQLRTNLRVLIDAGGLRSIVVTAPNTADDARMVARNLAIALSKAKVRVLLVEANLRRPTMAATFGFDGDPGLSQVLAGEADVDAVVRQWKETTLRVLPAGTYDEGAGELLASDTMDLLLERLERRFDLVIVDAPPLLEVADAAVLATRVDGVLITARHRGTRWDAVWGAVQALHDVQARVLGAVVLHRARRLDSAPREALRAPVAASRWSGAPAGTVPAPRTAGSGAVSPAASVSPGETALPKRTLRPVPNLKPQARGVAAVNGTRVDDSEDRKDA